MLINVKVTTNSKVNKAIDENGVLKVYLRSKPYKNKANEELIDFLSEYYNISKQNISIIKGLKSKNKLVSIKKS